MHNKLNGGCYEDVFNQMHILILVLSNTTIKISTNTNFEQIMVDFNINWHCKVFHQTNFGLGFKGTGIDFEHSFHWKTGTKNWQGTLNGRRDNIVIRFKS